MKKLLLVLLLFLGVLKADSDVKKALFDLTTSDLATIEKRLINGIAFSNKHYKSVGGGVDIRVVIHGGSNNFFVKDVSKTKCKEDKKLQAKEKEIHNKLI
ncbi:MAG: hypothetical protein AB7D34_05835, partial [Sulfurimonas sp.]